MRHLKRTSFGKPLRQRDVAGMRVSTTIYMGSSVLPTHEHEHAYLCLVASGGYRQSCPGREDDCTRGLLLVHPDGHRHADRFYPEGARSLDLFLPQAWSDGGGIRRLLSDYRHLRLPGVNALRLRIERELAATDDAADLALQAAVLELIACAARTDAGERSPPWMPKVLERLHDAPKSTPPLGELAALAGVHPAHLARTFKRVHGMSIGEYHRNLRIGAACRALARQHPSIAEIAADAGFNDQSHFTRVFRRLTGQTPGEFRTAQLSS